MATTAEGQTETENEPLIEPEYQYYRPFFIMQSLFRCGLFLNAVCCALCCPCQWHPGDVEHADKKLTAAYSKRMEIQRLLTDTHDAREYARLEKELDEVKNRIQDREADKAALYDMVRLQQALKLAPRELRLKR